MCKVKDNSVKGNSEQDSKFIEEIMKEYYDPDISVLSEEELEDILIEYVGNDIMDEKT